VAFGKIFSLAIKLGSKLFFLPIFWHAVLCKEKLKRLQPENDTQSSIYTYVGGEGEMDFELFSFLLPTRSEKEVKI
jgi:hypothetical protein